MSDPVRELQSTFVILDPQQNATTLSVTDTVWAEIDSRFGSFAGHILIASFQFTEDWPTWERHPKGDEIVCLLSGRAEMLLRNEGVESRQTLSRPGAFVVVPRGAWHTARIAEATTMLFVTPGEGTENREQPGD
jgi:mannose-6-phosphate isomerase-like protein (cupin superfamily)